MPMCWCCCTLILAAAMPAAGLTARLPSRIVRHTRLPVWPAWQGLPLVVLSQIPALRGFADQLEGAFGGRVCPIQFSDDEADPFILLVHHRHAFRPLDFLRPLFANIIMPEGFPAHPHRGFETMTYVLPGRAGLTHRDSEGTKMRYGDGAVQWMTAGRGMLHEEMWDVDAGTEHELYQLWVNLPPTAKFAPPRVQLIEPRSRPGATEVSREGATTVRRAPIVEERTRGGATVRHLVRGSSAGSAAAADGDGGDGGAETFSPMAITHVELEGKSASHTLPLPEGWTCIVYVRRGAVRFDGAAAATDGGAGAGTSDASQVAVMHDTVYMPRSGGNCLSLTNAGGGLSDVLVLAGEPIGAPVAASGTMVMNSPSEVEQALNDYRRGDFGVPWEHTLDDEEWAAMCDRRMGGRA